MTSGVVPKLGGSQVGWFPGWVVPKLGGSQVGWFPGWVVFRLGGSQVGWFPGWVVPRLGGSQVGVCSIFLRVDRSKNEIHKPRSILSIKVFNKKYVFI